MVISKEKSSTTFIFPTAITLQNGNIFVIEKLGIYIYNSIFSFIGTVYTFPEEDQITTKDDLSRVVIKRFQNYILALINYKFYFFSGQGQLIYGPSVRFFDQELEYYSLVPINFENNIFYFIIGFFDSSIYLNLKYAYYDFNNERYKIFFFKKR